MNRYANSLIARGYSREYAENAAADRADRARDDAIDRETEAHLRGLEREILPMTEAARAAIAKATGEA